MIQRHLLWRLYHLTNEINESTRSVEKANEKLAGLRDAVVSVIAEMRTDSQDTNDGKLKEAKKEQAKAQLLVKKREANVKKAEKALEDKKPELVTVKTQITHAEKKAANAQSLAERVEKDQEHQTESLRSLEDGAEEIKKRMHEAGGKFLVAWSHASNADVFDRETEKEESGRW